MKKQLSSILYIFLAAFLFASCGNMSNLSVAKRHYRGGYYVDFGHKKTIPVATTTTKNNVLPVNHSAPVVTANVVKTTEISPIVKTEQKPVISEKLTITRESGYKKDQNISTSILEENIHTSQAIETNKSTASGSSSSSTASSSAVPFWVVVVCAIFIPPLGVYFAYGIGTYFWIDLILTLLFFFPGMIFALIMVLQK